MQMYRRRLLGRQQRDVGLPRTSADLSAVDRDMEPGILSPLHPGWRRRPFEDGPEHRDPRVWRDEPNRVQREASGEPHIREVQWLRKELGFTHCKP